MERQMDALGRIVLPAGYRKQKNLQAGDVLCVDEQEGKRMIYPRKARCALCGGKKSFFPMGDILYVKPVGKNCCCFSERMRKLFRKNEKNVLRFCNKKAKEKRRLQRVKKPM